MFTNLANKDVLYGPICAVKQPFIPNKSDIRISGSLIGTP